MKKILLFAGTTEGRLIWDYCKELRIPVTACVATEYGESLLEPAPLSEILAGRMDREQMIELIRKDNFSRCIDATHPYARDVTENIVSACREKSISYIRVLREELKTEDILQFNSIGEAVTYLNQNTGNVLVTTGSKEVEAFTKIQDYKNRLYVRILPDIGGLKHCFDLGFSPSHMICMQGPFSIELNTGTLKQINASYLVTKEGGSFGGFMEKVEAAKATGAKVIVIKRPKKEEGLTLLEVFTILKDGR